MKYARKVQYVAITFFTTLVAISKAGTVLPAASKSFEGASEAVKECLQGIHVDVKNQDASKNVVVENLVDGAVLCYIRSSKKIGSTIENELTITKGPLVTFKDDTFKVNISKDKQTVSLDADSIDESKSVGLHSLKGKKEIALKKCEIQQ